LHELDNTLPTRKATAEASNIYYSVSLVNYCMSYNDFSKGFLLMPHSVYTSYVSLLYKLSAINANVQSGEWFPVGVPWLKIGWEALP